MGGRKQALEKRVGTKSMSLLLGTNGKPNPLRNEAPLNCVSLRSQLELEVTWEPVKGLDERPCGTPLTAPHVTPEGTADGKQLIR